MSTWWYEYNQQSGYPQGFSDFIQWANQVNGWSKDKCQSFALIYKLSKRKDIPKRIKKMATEGLLM